MEVLIASRHAGALAWLGRQGITGDVRQHVADADVRGRVVVGNVPMGLAVLAEAVWQIEMPDLPADARGRDLTPEEMDSFGARLVEYQVTRPPDKIHGPCAPWVDLDDMPDDAAQRERDLHKVALAEAPAEAAKHWPGIPWAVLPAQLKALAYRYIREGLEE